MEDLLLAFLAFLEMAFEIPRQKLLGHGVLLYHMVRYLEEQLHA